MSVKYDVAVKTGAYTDNQGAQKNRYENVGVVMEGQDGGLYMLMKATFNPAGVKEAGKDKILLSFFNPKNNQQQNSTQGQAQQPAQPASALVLDDEIPF